MKATFFVVAERLQQAPLRVPVERTRVQGHRIANRTMIHCIPLVRRNEAEVAHSEIGEAQAVLAGLADERYFRPNGDKGQSGKHLLSEDATDNLVAHQYTVVCWNCVPHGWILLVLHVHCTDSMQHLGGFLDSLITHGYEFSQDFPAESRLIDHGIKTDVLKDRYTPRSQKIAVGAE